MFIHGEHTTRISMESCPHTLLVIYGGLGQYHMQVGG